MRHYHHIDLPGHTVRTENLEGEAIVRAGRYLIARTMTERQLGSVDPLSGDNPLIFSAGPFAGTNFSNANRVSVGCKSPLTLGIKEANGGGTFAFALGQLKIAGLTLEGKADEWIMLHFRKGGEIDFLDAREYLGMGNFETAEKLHERFGRKVSLAICGPVGEYQGLLAGIAFSDVDLRPSRLAARGGVGAVMGSKKVKAIIVDLDRMPPLHERRKVMGAVKEYRKMLDAEPAIQAFQKTGTAMVADYTNHVGGIPVRNFTAGQSIDTESGPFRLGGDYLREQNLARGGVQTHACMPGCIIQCSNVYADEDGREVVSPVEYETIGLLGTNCGLEDPDDLARLNYQANDLGIDTIELGGTIGVLMDAGIGRFGDVQFMQSVLDGMRQGSQEGKFHAQGTARVGTALGVKRVPVIKRQAISAYDPRVIEVTGLTMMMTAQGADHTAGNLPSYDCQGKTAEELVTVSLDIQVMCAAVDSLGLCVFGRSVTNEQLDFIVQAINDAHGVQLPVSFFRQLGRDTLRLENEFNLAAGFSETDDELPSFFYTEPLPPSQRAARFHAAEVNTAASKWWS
ncbi:MAG: aldehyde ferredoxin oxidoreductase [Granulosicoccus sp.]|nr:aldehyde ferredoxin oxidoreductase [Granulosicoccus sp.]